METKKKADSAHPEGCALGGNLIGLVKEAGSVCDLSVVLTNMP